MVIPVELKQRWKNRRDVWTELQRAHPKLSKYLKRDADYVPESLKHAARPKTIMRRDQQLLFLAWLVVPLLLASYLDPAGAKQASAWHVATTALAPGYVLSAAFVAATLALCVERVCYTVIWCWPDAFRRRVEAYKGRTCTGKEIVNVIVDAFMVNKAFQLLGFALLYAAAGAPTALPSLFQVVVGANLAALGQVLNGGIYRAIGKAGVYYGYKFGVHVPWCTGFPFNVVTAHPQYLGCVLTAYGIVLLGATDAHVAAGWGGLAHVQALLYAYMSYVEHNL